MPPPKARLAALAVTALFADRSRGRREAATLLLAQDCFARRASVLGVAPVADQDWVRLTQSQFAPVRDHARRSGSCRPGTSRRPQAAQVIRLDPGLAFGTGTHPTTRMCLRWIAAHVPSAARAARARLRLRLRHPRDRRRAARRARTIDAVDIDPAAVDATRAQRARQRRRVQRRPAAGRERELRSWSWPTSWPRRSSCSRRCSAAHVAGRPIWCWPASSSARPTN